MVLALDMEEVIRKLSLMPGPSMCVMPTFVGYVRLHHIEDDIGQLFELKSPCTLVSLRIIQDLSAHAGLLQWPASLE